MSHPTFLDEFLSSRAIYPAVAAARGYYFMERQSIDGGRDTSWEDDPDLRKFSKRHRRPSIVIPTFGVDGERNGVQLRPRHPGDPKQKYVNPLGEPAKRLNVHPWTVQYLPDTSIPLWVTEGIPKADSLVSHDMAAIGLISVTTWKCPDWDLIPLQDRNVFIVFDSDYALNPMVRKQQQELALFLQRRNAHVWVTYLPPTDSDDPQKQGVDDWLATWPIDQRYSIDRAKDLIDLSERYVPADDDEREARIESLIEKMDEHRIATERLALRRQRGDDNRVSRLIRSSDLRARQEEPWLVTDALPPKGIAQLYGPSFEGKSLVSLDLALSLVNESVTEWFGRKIERHGPVIVVLMEGDFRYEKNIEAWLEAHPGTNDDDLWFLVREALDLCSEASVEWLRQDIEALDIDPAMIVIDTQSRAMPGANESSAQDHNLAHSNIERHLSTRFECLVQLIHHTGLDESRERGSSAQRANVETKAIVKSRTLRFEKTRAISEDQMLRANFRIEQAPVFEGGTGGAYVRPATEMEVIHDRATADLELIDKILQVVTDKPGISKSKVADEVGGNKATCLRLIDELVAQGRVRNTGTENRWRLTI